MPFNLIKNIGADSAPLSYLLLTDVEGVVVGEALKQVNGRLTKAGATDIPEFIAQRTQAAEATSVTPIPVFRTMETQEFETTSTATVASTLVGQKVTLDTSGDKVTATTTSGVFLIATTDGAATNSRVRGFFRR